jgi:hypothetical protein
MKGAMALPNRRAVCFLIWQHSGKNAKSKVKSGMRLHFPNGEHPDTFWAEGRLSIGRGAAHRVRIEHASVAENHLLIDADPVRGIELLVQNLADVHINGRPIKAKALARLGDMVLLGPVKMLIKADSDKRDEPPPSSNDGVPAGIKNLAARAMLRAVSGQYFGKVIGLKVRTTIGRGSECDLVLDEPEMSRQHACIESTGSGIFLRDLGSANGTYVNGVLVRDAVLKPGDQIAFDQNRFLLETVGVSPIELVTSPTPTAPPPPSGAPVHTQVGFKIVPPPAAPVESPVNAAVDMPLNTRRIGNFLMLLAALGALAGLGWLLSQNMKHF